MKKRILRKILYPIILNSRIIKFFPLRENTLILTYHGVVSNPDFELSNNHISTQQFEQHLAYFNENFNVISSDEAFLNTKDKSKPNIVITFDDGYENNYTNAFPLLKKYNFPATIFIVSEAHKTENYKTWYDRFDLLKFFSTSKKLELKNLYESEEITTNDWAELKNFLKKQSQKKKIGVIEKIEEQLCIPDTFFKNYTEQWKMLNEKQIRELSYSELIKIGSHTVSHPNLSEISIDMAEVEITTSKNELENIIGKEVNSIAFPDGSYNEVIKKICIDSGYNKLFAVDYRCLGDREDKNIKSRFSLSNSTTYEANILSFYKAFNKFGV